jgi:hypothetical protein
LQKALPISSGLGFLPLNRQRSRNTVIIHEA